MNNLRSPYNSTDGLRPDLYSARPPHRSHRSPGHHQRQRSPFQQPNFVQNLPPPAYCASPYGHNPRSHGPVGNRNYYVHSDYRRSASNTSSRSQVHNFIILSLECNVLFLIRIKNVTQAEAITCVTIFIRLCWKILGKNSTYLHLFRSNQSQNWLQIIRTLWMIRKSNAVMFFL